MTSSTYFSFIGWVSADQVKLLQAVARNSEHVQNWDPSRTDAKRRATARNWVASQCTSKKWLAHETKRNETKWTATQRTESISFRFSSLQFSSFRFVSFRRSALTCARTELQRTATNRFWTVLGRRDPVLSTNQSRAECRFAENSRRIIQFRRILETSMCRLPYLTHSRDYNYRRKCFIETQI